MNNFAQDLAYSHDAEDQPFIEALCRKAFPNLVNFARSSGNTPAQHMGIDRWLCLANGRALTVDFKIRRESYPDILLEFESSKGRTGWMEKDLPIDFLIYAVVPTQTGYILPWPQLRKAWIDHKAEWFQRARHDKRFRLVDAVNSTYITKSICIPVEELLDAVQSASIIRLPDASTTRRSNGPISSSAS